MPTACAPSTARFPYVTYEPGVVYDEAPMQWEKEDASGIAKAVAAARGADVIVACVGENSYCETPGNMDDLNLSAGQKKLVRELAALGKPIVLVLNEGRPRLIGDIEPLAAAVVDVMLPALHLFQAHQRPAYLRLQGVRAP